RGGNNAALLFSLGQLGNLVVGTTQLEGKHRLQVLPLEQDPVIKAAAELMRLIYGGFDSEIIDFGVQDLLDIAMGHGFTQDIFWLPRRLATGPKKLKDGSV